MGHTGLCARAQSVHVILQDAVGVCDAFVLPEMFEPRRHLEHLDEPAGLRGVLEDVPRIGTVAAAMPAQPADRLRKSSRSPAAS